MIWTRFYLFNIFCLLSKQTVVSFLRGNNISPFLFAIDFVVIIYIALSHNHKDSSVELITAK